MLTYFLCLWLIPIFLNYLLLRHDLKRNPDSADGCLLKMLIWMIVPIFNILLLIVLVLDFIENLGIDENRLAHIIFLVRRKKG